MRDPSRRTHQGEPDLASRLLEKRLRFQTPPGIHRVSLATFMEEKHEANIAGTKGFSFAIRDSLKLYEAGKNI